VNTNRFWLLNIAATFAVPLRLIVDDPRAIRSRFNIHPHAMSRMEVVNEIAAMLREGLFLAEHWELSKEKHWELLLDGLSPKKDELSQSLNEPSVDYAFYLTEAGGAQWESIAVPNWDLYCNTRHEHEQVDGSETISIECSSRLQIRRAVESLSVEYTFASWDEKQFACLVPWQCTYWKTLPEGYRGTFRGFLKEPVDSTGLGKRLQMGVWCLRGFSLATCRELANPANLE
jgi:hypothetical protein